MEMSSDSMTNQVTNDTIVEFRCISTDCLGNIIQMISCFCKFYTLKEALLCHFHELSCFR